MKKSVWVVKNGELVFTANVLVNSSAQCFASLVNNVYSRFPKRDGFETYIRFIVGEETHEFLIEKTAA